MCCAFSEFADFTISLLLILTVVGVLVMEGQSQNQNNNAYPSQGLVKEGSQKHARFAPLPPQSSGGQNMYPRPTPQQIQRAKEKREQVLKQTRKEKRVMFLLSLGAACGIAIWIIAIVTDSW